jgi:hypothetical protein
MSDNRQAWDFHQAVEASRKAKEAQIEAEEIVRLSAKEYAEAERLYRVGLAKRIVELVAEGKPATVAKDLARGDPRVADLAYDMAVALGVKEAMEQRAWRHTADRKDVQNLTEWSKLVAPMGEPRS